MTPHALILEVEKTRRALTEEDVSMLEREGSWGDLCDACLVARLDTPEPLLSRLTARMKALK